MMWEIIFLHYVTHKMRAIVHGQLVIIAYFKVLQNPDFITTDGLNNEYFIMRDSQTSIYDPPHYLA